MGVIKGEVIYFKGFSEKHLNQKKADTKNPIPNLRILLSGLRKEEKKYTYKLCPNAEEKTNEAISLAKMISKDFEINTMITRHDHAIHISMDIDYGWYRGPIKRALDKLIGSSDDYFLTSYKNKPGCFTIIISYLTHDRYLHGRKIEW